MTKEKTPDRVNIRKSDKKDYDRLKEKDSPFAGCENKDLFIMSMMVGFHEGSRLELDKKEGFVRTEYFSEREKAIIKAIAINEEANLEVLRDKEYVYSIAEEYAAGGIKILKEKALGDDFANYFKRLESDLNDELTKILKVNYG
jgi:dnd system-associated protein 4